MLFVSQSLRFSVFVDRIRPEHYFLFFVSETSLSSAQAAPAQAQKTGENVILLHPMRNIMAPHITSIPVMKAWESALSLSFLRIMNRTEIMSVNRAMTEGIPRVAAV